MNLISIICAFLHLFQNPITSTFGENRDGRYHLGVDFSTFKKDGFPIYFPFETEVIRLKVNFTGYGKVLYLRDKKGFIYVLAHLQRFNDFIDSIVFQQLKKEKSNEIDLWFENGIKIDKQDTICYIGHSGTEIPHLHFEIRKNMNIAINPLKFIKVKDTIPPLIEKILLIPLGKSIINSSYFPLLITRKIKKVYGKGEFLIWVKAFDTQDNNNTIAPYMLKIFKDDTLIFFKKMDTIFIPNQKETINLYYKDGKFFSKSWIHPFPVTINGIRNYEIKVIVQDYNYNRDSIIFKIESKLPKEISRRVKIPATFYFFDGIAFRTGKEIKKVYVFFKNKVTALNTFDAGYYREFKWIPPPGFEGKVKFIFEGKRKTQKEYYVLFSENTLKSIKINDFYIKYKSPFPFYFYIQTYKNKIKIFPYFCIFNTLEIKKEMENKEYWVSGGKFAGKDYITTFRGGIFEIKSDTIPPVFKGDTIIHSKNPFDINFLIYDPESGIEGKSIKLYIDGEFIPVFYYPADKKLELFKKIKLKPGVHEFSLSFSDRVKNFTYIKGKILSRP